MKHLLIAAVLTLGFAAPLCAQVTVPYTFVSGTTILSAQVNANFAKFSDALNRTGGTMTGTLNTVTIRPATDAAYALGDVTHRYTILWVSGATAGGSAYGTGNAIGFTAAGTTGQVLVSNGTSAPTWGTGIPSGTLVFSIAGACSSGWTEYTALRGRYIVGLPSGGTNLGTSGTALTDLEARASGTHTHTITDPGHNHTQNSHTHPTYIAGADGGTPEIDDAGSGNGTQGAQNPTNLIGATTATNIANTTGITINNSGSVAGTNAPYIQMIACTKD